MSTFVLKFKEILKYTQHTYIQKQFMSVRIQDVNDFRKNRDNLIRAIVDLVDFSKRTLGEDNKLSSISIDTNNIACHVHLIASIT